MLLLVCQFKQKELGGGLLCGGGIRSGHCLQLPSYNNVRK